MAPPPWQPAYNFTSTIHSLVPYCWVFLFVFVLNYASSCFFPFCGPLKDGCESPGETRDFSGSECSCPPPCLRGFMELEDLFRVDPEGVRLQNQQELIPSGETSAQHAESGFQTYQWFNLIYCSPSWAPTNPAELLESCSRSSPVWSRWSALGKEAKRSSGDVTFMSWSVTVVTESIIMWCKTVSRTHV